MSTALWRFLKQGNDATGPLCRAFWVPSHKKTAHGFRQETGTEETVANSIIKEIPEMRT